MVRKRASIVLSVLAFLLPAAQAQRLSLDLRTTAGHNYAQGGYASVGALGCYRPDSAVAVRFGVQCGTGAVMAYTADWTAAMRLGSVKLQLVSKGLWRRFAGWHIDEFSGLAAIGIGWRGWDVHVGLASRMMADSRTAWLDERTDWLSEPFNLMYELRYKAWFGTRRRWLGELAVANYDDFVIDRAYQPLFSCSAGWLVSEKVELAARAVLHPTGMLSLSANYYEAWFNIQMILKW